MIFRQVGSPAGDSEDILATGFLYKSSQKKPGNFLKRRYEVVKGSATTVLRYYHPANPVQPKGHMDLHQLKQLRHYVTPRQHTEFCLDFGAAARGTDASPSSSGASNSTMLLLQCRGTAADVRRWRTVFTNQVESNASRLRANESLSRVMQGGGDMLDLVLRAMANGGIGVQLRVVGSIGQAEGADDNGGSCSTELPKSVGVDPASHTAPARIGTRRLESFVVVDGFVSQEAGLHNARQPQGGLIPGDAIMAVNNMTTRGRDASGVAELFARAMRESVQKEMNVTVLRKAAVSKAVDTLCRLGNNSKVGRLRQAGRQMDSELAAKIVQTRWRQHRVMHSAPARVRHLASQQRQPHAQFTVPEACCSEPSSPGLRGVVCAPTGPAARATTTDGDVRDRQIEGAHSAISAIVNSKQIPAGPPLPTPACTTELTGSALQPGSVADAPVWAVSGLAQTAGDTFDSDSNSSACGEE